MLRSKLERAREVEQSHECDGHPVTEIMPKSISSNLSVSWEASSSRGYPEGLLRIEDNVCSLDVPAINMFLQAVPSNLTFFLLFCLSRH